MGHSNSFFKDKFNGRKKNFCFYSNIFVGSTVREAFLSTEIPDLGFSEQDMMELAFAVYRYLKFFSSLKIRLRIVVIFCEFLYSVAEPHRLDAAPFPAPEKKRKNVASTHILKFCYYCDIQKCSVLEILCGSLRLRSARLFFEIFKAYFDIYLVVFPHAIHNP
jgi:hypothetical protein